MGRQSAILVASVSVGDWVVREDGGRELGVRSFAACAALTGLAARPRSAAIVLVGTLVLRCPHRNLPNLVGGRYCASYPVGPVDAATRARSREDALALLGRRSLCDLGRQRRDQDGDCGSHGAANTPSSLSLGLARSLLSLQRWRFRDRANELAEVGAHGAIRGHWIASNGMRRMCGWLGQPVGSRPGRSPHPDPTGAQPTAPRSYTLGCASGLLFGFGSGLECWSPRWSPQSNPAMP
jgi:hypothetical protein